MCNVFLPAFTNPSMKRLLALAGAFAAFGCHAGSAPTPAGTTTAAITAEDLRQRLFLIADDSMMGRESGSAGNYKTAAYVASEFKRLGLEPAGENGTYFQTVPYWNAAADPASTLQSGSTVFRLRRDFVPSNIRAAPRTLSATPVIYGGPMNDSSHWISAADAAGKFVILDLPRGIPMRGIAISPRFRSALALGLVVLDVLGSETTARLLDGRPLPDSSRNVNAIPIVWLTRSAATVMLGADPSTLGAGQLGPVVTGHFDITRRSVPYPARNVVAILRGSDPVLRNEYVSVTAHNDHVGFDHSPVDHDSLRAFNRVVRPMGADSPNREPTAAEWPQIRTILDGLRKVNRPRLDSIRNGADDDGSGTVGILEIAEAISHAAVKPRRSILFVNHVGEEDGLVGSHWFTDHATVPIDAIVAEIDQDMTGRGSATDFPRNGGTVAATPTYLEVVGAKRLSKEFGDSLEAANSREPMPFVFDYTFDAPGHPLQYYCRADHYSYARYGIPAVAFSRGEHLDYHQITDEPQYIDYPDLTRVTKMVYSAALVIANMPHRPRLDAPRQTNPNAQCRQ
ncbi:MAG: peptidase [Gemmatimonadetes bacterium]|nr:peptidase [Gemmatimonadota bacterium]